MFISGRRICWSCLWHRHHIGHIGFYWNWPHRASVHQICCVLCILHAYTIYTMWPDIYIYIYYVTCTSCIWNCVQHQACLDISNINYHSNLCISYEWYFAKYIIETCLDMKIEVHNHSSVCYANHQAVSSQVHAQSQHSKHPKINNIRWLSMLIFSPFGKKSTSGSQSTLHMSWFIALLELVFGTKTFYLSHAQDLKLPRLAFHLGTHPQQAHVVSHIERPRYSCTASIRWLVA